MQKILVVVCVVLLVIIIWGMYAFLGSNQAGQTASSAANTATTAPAEPPPPPAIPLPVLTAPAAGAVHDGLTVKFTWQAVPAVQDYEINVRNDRNFGGDGDLCLAPTGGPAGYTRVFSEDLAGKQLYWRVRAKKNDLWGGWSPVASFSMKAVPAAGAAVEPVTSREDICRGLEMTVAMPGAPCPAGTLLYSVVNWTNVSGQVIRVPKNLGACHIIGTRWSYIERVGGDPVIPSLSQSRFRDNRYLLTRTNINAYKDAIQPGETINSERNSVNLVDTTGFLPGRYRYTVEYYYFHDPPTAATQAELAQVKSIDFQVL